MKLLFCLLAIIVVAHAQDLSQLTITIPNLPCLCQLAGSLSDGNCTFFCNTTASDSQCSSPLEGEEEFETFSLAEIRSQVISSVEVNAEVTARIEAIFAEATTKCQAIDLTSLAAATASLTSAISFADYDGVLGEVAKDTTDSLRELAGSFVDGRFSAEVGVEYENETLIAEARVEIKSATGVDLLKKAKQTQEESLKKIKRYYAVYLKHLKVKEAFANATVASILKLLGQAKFYKCLSNRISTETNVDFTLKAGFTTLSASLKAVLSDRFGEIECNARRAVRALVFIAKRVQKFPEWLQAKVTLSQNVIADLNLRITSFANYKEKSLEDVKVTLKTASLLQKIAETVKSLAENVTDVSIEFSSETSVKVEHNLKGFIVRASTETQAEFDAKVADLKAYFKKAIATLAVVDEASVTINLDVSVTASTTATGTKRALLANGGQEYSVSGTSQVAPAAAGTTSPASVATFSAVVLAVISFLALLF